MCRFFRFFKPCFRLRDVGNSENEGTYFAGGGGWGVAGRVSLNKEIPILEIPMTHVALL